MTWSETNATAKTGRRNPHAMVGERAAPATIIMAYCAPVTLMGGAPSTSSAAALGGIPDGMREATKNNPKSVDKPANPPVCRCLDTTASTITVEAPMDTVPAHRSTPPAVALSPLGP